jgi:hypothetical protein
MGAKTPGLDRLERARLGGKWRTLEAPNLLVQLPKRRGRSGQGRRGIPPLGLERYSQGPVALGRVRRFRLRFRSVWELLVTFSARNG